MSDITVILNKQINTIQNQTIKSKKNMSYQNNSEGFENLLFYITKNGGEFKIIN